MKKRLVHLERLFPNLHRVGYVPKSDPVARYNCVAWAAGDDTRQWQGSNIDGYWPAGAIEGYDMPALVSAFQVLGYSLCAGDALEPGYEKVALYGDGSGGWSHAALQLPDGRWTSKIGRIEDIIHNRPSALVGTEYGNVMYYMKRPATAAIPKARGKREKTKPARSKKRKA